MVSILMGKVLSRQIGRQDISCWDNFGCVVRLGKGKHEHQDVGAYFTQSIVDTIEWPDGDECFGEVVFEFFEDGTLAVTLINLVWDKQQDSRNKKIGIEYDDRRNTTDVR